MIPLSLLGLRINIRPALITLTAFIAITIALVFVESRQTTRHPHISLPPPAVHLQRIGLTGAQSVCQTTGTECRRALLDLMNADRTALGVPPLALNWNLSKGIGCVGAAGHSRAMAATNSAWHYAPSPTYDYASFSGDMAPCVGYRAMAQNVGADWGVSKWNAIETVYTMMMKEPHDSATCATTVNHACTILSRSYVATGIGLSSGSGGWFLVMDFF